MLFQRIKKRVDKVKIASHKRLLVLWAVYPCKIKYEIGFCAVFVEKGRIGVYIVFKDLPNVKGRTRFVLAVSDVF